MAKVRMPLSEKVKQGLFLAAYINHGAISYAAKEVDIKPDQHEWWLKNDEEYGVEFDRAKKAALEVLEREARRRAVEGVDMPVYQGGALVGVVRKYSDQLLMFLLKGHAPEKYRDYVTITHDINAAAKAAADELGLDVEAILAEADRLVRLER